MTIKRISLCLTFIFILGNAHAVSSWEVFDRIIAVVNDTPIIKSELEQKFDRLTSTKKIRKSRYNVEKSRVLDKFIQEAIVRQEAERQAILVSEEKVMIHIKNLMRSNNIDSLDKFKEIVEKRENIPFPQYKDEIRQQITTEQVISIAIGVSPPSHEEAREWFKNNRRKLGYQVHLKHILIRPKDRSFSEEKRVSQEVKKLRNRIIRGESFEKIAAEYSQDPGSARKGGDLGWVSLAELDPYMANKVHKMRKPGQISGVIKSGYGYHVVKYLGRRAVPYEAVENRILNMLYQRNMQEQFEKWVAQMRRESDIKIYMENYVKS
jgi:peptidyl-prolyl cis-trans isomerase SurA